MVEQLFKLKNLHEMKVNTDFLHHTIPCRIKGTSKIGQYFGNIIIKHSAHASIQHMQAFEQLSECAIVNHTIWAIVLMSGFDNPSFIEMDKIEVLKPKWSDIK